MQIKSLRIKSYRSWPINDTSSAEAIKRLKKLELYEQLKTEGCSSATCLLVIDWSKATYYRWRSRYQQQGLTGLEALSCRPQRVRKPSWSKQQEQQVQHLRQRHRLWGKRKIWKVLNRDRGFTLSISTVGRILKKLLRLNRIVPVAFYFGRIKPKRRRQFKHHAKRWKYGMKARQPGELMQVDHMSVSFTEGFALKEFKATCPVTGTTIMRAYSRASSRNAKRFLNELSQQLPFELLSIQVDGGGPRGAGRLNSGRFNAPHATGISRQRAELLLLRENPGHHVAGHHHAYAVLFYSRVLQCLSHGFR